ncbi:DedA family protein [Vogesella facilis]|uniref:DedA family protein n=1 Tax=Vogesella facilis TaxID=1655232 RepID=A0ABV7RHA8_9NEIS
MTLAQLLADYGYLAVFVGAVLEGESLLLLAGFAAQQGYLSLPLVVLLALGGGTLGDQLFFWLGRRYNAALLRRLPAGVQRAEQVNRLLLRYDAWVIVGVRFMYGLRVIGPIVIGMSRVSAWRFAGFNLLGAAIWAPLIAGCGFLFGHSLQWLFADLQRYQEAALLALIALLLAGKLLLHWRRRRR